MANWFSPEIAPAYVRGAEALIYPSGSDSFWLYEDRLTIDSSIVKLI